MPRNRILFWTRFGLYFRLPTGWALAPAGDSLVKWHWSRMGEMTREVWRREW